MCANKTKHVNYTHIKGIKKWEKLKNKSKRNENGKRRGFVQHLPNGGKPPATEEDEGLRAFLDSKWDMDSDSGCLLPVILAWEEFCENIMFIHALLQGNTRKVEKISL